MSDKTCFYIAPMGPPGTELLQRSERMFRHMVEPAVTQSGFNLLRTDYVTAVGSITADTVKHVVESDLVIADISGANPNVMYELGVRHTTRKPVIHIAATGERIPFDLINVRTLIVDLQDMDSSAYARRDLMKMISAVATETVESATPISEAADVSAFEKLAIRQDGATSPMISVLKDIEGRLTSIERRAAQVREPPNQYSRRIFIVHGHDSDIKNELARFLQKLDFHPIILHERADRGQTIIAKLRDEMSDVGFAFVLLTPDDVGGLASKKAT